MRLAGIRVRLKEVQNFHVFGGGVEMGPQAGLGFNVKQFRGSLPGYRGVSPVSPRLPEVLQLLLSHFIWAGPSS